MTMTSRQRVWNAINHREPDRVPIDIGGTKVTGVHVDEYLEIGKYLGIDIELPKVYEQFQMLARVDESMMGWFHADVIQLEHPVETWGLENKDWKPWTTNVGNRVLMPGAYNPVKDDDGCLHLCDAKGTSLAVMAPTSIYYDRDCLTGMSPGDIVHMSPEKWQRSIALYTDDQLTQLGKRAAFLHENTEYSIHGGFLKGGLGTNGIFAGHTIGDWLCILASEQEYAQDILTATAERTVQNLELYLQAVGKYVDTILISGTDFGTQKGELFSPETFKKLFLPIYRLINDYVHGNSKAKTMLHSCGSNWNIIEYFIEAGVDILNPVQTNTANMEPRKLKERFGDKIVFWGGGADTQHVLPHGTADDVREQVKQRLEVFAPGGGFVFTPVHNLQYGVPPRNVEVMIETVMAFGGYPIQ